MTSNVKVCMPSEINKLLSWGWPELAKICINSLIFKKNMFVNRYANHVLSIFNRMPQHYIHTVYCYKTFQYKRYTKCKYILTTLPYRINPKHVITDSEVSNMENETVCKFRSNIIDICILDSFGYAVWGYQHTHTHRNSLALPKVNCWLGCIAKVNNTIPIRYFPPFNYTKWHLKSPLTKAAHTVHNVISMREFVIPFTSIPPIRQLKSVHNWNYEKN